MAKGYQGEALISEFTWYKTKLFPQALERMAEEAEEDGREEKLSTLAEILAAIERDEDV